MTVVACYQTKNQNWIASDGISSTEDYFLVESSPKVFYKNNYAVGFAISFRAGDIIQELETLPKDIKCIEDMRDFRDHVMLAMIEEGGCEQRAESGDTMSHPLELIVISSYGMWCLNSDYHITEVTEGYYAIGMGEQVAVGSLYTSALYKEEDGEKAIYAAVASAIKHTGGCDGKTHMLSLERKRRRTRDGRAKKSSENSKKRKKVDRKATSRKSNKVR